LKIAIENKSGTLEATRGGRRGDREPSRRRRRFFTGGSRPFCLLRRRSFITVAATCGRQSQTQGHGTKREAPERSRRFHDGTQDNCCSFICPRHMESAERTSPVRWRDFVLAALGLQAELV